MANTPNYASTPSEGESALRAENEVLVAEKESLTTVTESLTGELVSENERLVAEFEAPRKTAREHDTLARAKQGLIGLVTKLGSQPDTLRAKLDGTGMPAPNGPVLAMPMAMPMPRPASESWYAPGGSAG